MTKNIAFTAILKDGGYKNLMIPDNVLSTLAIAIREKGSEILHTTEDSYCIAGILLYGKDVGERVIVIGGKSEEI